MVLENLCFMIKCYFKFKNEKGYLKSFYKDFYNEKQYNQYRCRLALNGCTIFKSYIFDVPKKAGKKEKPYKPPILTDSQKIEYKQIIKNSKKVKNIVCIYALVNDNEIVYIGQTENLIKRLAQHMREKQGKFNSISVLKEYKEWSEYEVFEDEKEYIRTYKPRLNKVLYNQTK